MMRVRRLMMSYRWTVAALAVLISAACDWDDPDEIQNSSNFAVVRAQFFASRSNRVPVPGVRLMIESDPDSERPYLGPDVAAISGAGGVATAQVFTGAPGEPRHGSRQP